MVVGGEPSVYCRVVSRPSSGSGYDQIDNPWPCSFTWAEIAFDQDGPYFVVDLMHNPGALLFENGIDAAQYRSGLVYHDQVPTSSSTQIPLVISSTKLQLFAKNLHDQVAVRDEIVRVEKDAMTETKKKKK